MVAIFLRLLLAASLLLPAELQAGIILFGRTQESLDTPFVPGRNPDYNGLPGTLTATNAQDAIEEAFQNAPGKASRFAVNFGLQGNKSNAYFFLFNNVTSDTSPFVLSEAGTIKGLSVSNTLTAGPVVYTVYKNNVALTTLTKPNGVMLAFVSGLNIANAAGDTIAVKVTSGATNDTVFTVFFQTSI